MRNIWLKWFPWVFILWGCFSPNFIFLQSKGPEDLYKVSIFWIINILKTYPLARNILSQKLKKKKNSHNFLHNVSRESFAERQLISTNTLINFYDTLPKFCKQMKLLIFEDSRQYFLGYFIKKAPLSTKDKEGGSRPKI